MASMSGKRFAQSATLSFNVNHYKIRLFLETNFEKYDMCILYFMLYFLLLILVCTQLTRHRLSNQLDLFAVEKLNIGSR